LGKTGIKNKKEQREGGEKIRQKRVREKRTKKKEKKLKKYRMERK
jgi:hypothetical protein